MRHLALNQAHSWVRLPGNAPDFQARLAKWSKASDCKSDRLKSPHGSSTLPTCSNMARLAQWTERCTPKAEVAASNSALGSSYTCLDTHTFHSKFICRRLLRKLYDTGRLRSAKIGCSDAAKAMSAATSGAVRATARSIKQAHRAVARRRFSYQMGGPNSDANARQRTRAYRPWETKGTEARGQATGGAVRPCKTSSPGCSEKGSA